MPPARAVPVHASGSFHAFASSPSESPSSVRQPSPRLVALGFGGPAGERRFGVAGRRGEHQREHADVVEQVAEWDVARRRVPERLVGNVRDQGGETGGCRFHVHGHRCSFGGIVRTDRPPAR